MTIKIIIADDHKIVRDGLRSLIEKQPGMEVTAEANNGKVAVQLARELLPDIIIMDIAMPDLNGMEATRRIVSETSGVKVIALSMHSDRRFVVEMLKARASGYLLKDCAFEELIAAIRTVMKNQLYLSPQVTGMVIKDYVENLSRAGPSVFSVLTIREREILQLLSEGKSTRNISSCLNISEKTIETHRRRIMNKLNIFTIAGLTKYAIREGITTAE